ncbi:MAG TPA: NADH-quinone oxidoreductase subunit L [Kofleriaceae bacterium]|nr:NADH-quinone oxidoreductase subunit L [Kofleriaceae bacterium]
MDPSTLKFLDLPLLAWIPLLPFIGAALNLVLGRWLSRGTVHAIAIASVAASCGIAAYLVFGPLLALFKNAPANAVIDQPVYTWIEAGRLKLDLAFRLDTLSAVMILIVTFVGLLIHIYSTGYMAHDPRYAAFFGYLNLFMGSMLVLVLAANMPVMFIGWEGVGMCSFLLIGFWYENESYATAGRKAFVVNRIGDFAFLTGMFLLFWATKDITAGQSSLDFRALSTLPAIQDTYVSPLWGGERLAAAAGIFLFIGACGKSAQLPLFVWLPDAMAGPTPVSALIHAATMVTAGVYMVVRLSFLYAASTTALGVIAVIGLLTALAAAFMAFAQTDLKKVLAYSTVSQLGFMFVAAGTGNWVAAIFHLGTHAFFKACLFLGAGSVMHAMEHAGSEAPGDIMQMGGLRKKLPLTRITFMISCLAIAGIFPFAGFFSKDEILGGAWSVEPPGWPWWTGKVFWAGLLIGALGTAFYMWRLYFLVFSGEPRSAAAKGAHESPLNMTGPLLVLAFLATIAGFIGLPHLKSWHAPKILHGLSVWLEPAVSSEWNDPIDPTARVAGSARSRLATDLARKAPQSECCCVTPGAVTSQPMTAEACAAKGGNAVCTLSPTKQCVLEEASDAQTFVLMGVALAIGGLGILMAWALYGRGPSKHVDRWTAGGLGPVYEASKHKLWFDEIYDRILVRPFRTAARGLLEVVDRFVIDTVAVNGSAFVVGLFGRLARWIQNGQVQRYLAGIVVGAALVFLVSRCQEETSFDYAFEGELVRLTAAPGEGISSLVKIEWDLDSDGTIDAAGAELTRVRGDVGTVTMWVEDSITRERRRVTRVVVVPAERGK